MVPNLFTELKQNHALYRSKCLEAQEFAREYYDWSKVIEPWINLLFIMNDLIQVIDCLSQEQVATVLNNLNQDHWAPSTVFIGDGQTGVEKSIRNNDRICLPDKILISDIYA